MSHHFSLLWSFVSFPVLPSIKTPCICCMRSAIMCFLYHDDSKAVLLKHRLPSLFEGVIFFKQLQKDKSLNSHYLLYKNLMVQKYTVSLYEKYSLWQYKKWREKINEILAYNQWLPQLLYGRISSFLIIIFRHLAINHSTTLAAIITMCVM